MRLEGFVTVGRGELLLTLIAVALLMAVLGYALGQIVLMARRPAPLKLRPMTPEDEERGRKMLREMCPGPHCDDEKQMNAWLRSKDFSLITNEVLAAMRNDLRRAHQREQQRPAFLDVDLAAYTEAWLAQQKAPTDADENTTTRWPGGDPDAV